MILGLSFSAWVTLGTIVFLLLMLFFTKVKTDVIFLMCLLILLVSGTLNLKQTFSGFVSNAALIVAFIAVMVGAMRKTHIIDWLMEKCFGNGESYVKTQLRLTLFSASLSMFVPNVVAGLLMFRGIDSWASHHSIRPSKLLLPVGFAISLGGIMTTIGRSTGLIWVDMYDSFTGQSVPLYGPAIFAFPIAVVCFVLMLLMRNKLPDKDSVREIGEKAHEFITELTVPADSELCGMTVAESGIYASLDFCLISIRAFDNETYEDVTPDACILGGDHLLFSGDISKVMQMADRWNLQKDDKIERKGMMFANTRYQQLAVVQRGSDIIGKTFAELQFEKKHNVVVMAMARNGRYLTDTPRNIKIAAGDIVVFYGNKLHWQTLTSILTRQDCDELFNYDWHSLASFMIMCTVILLSILNVIPLVEGAFIGAMLTAVCGCISRKDAWASLPWSTIVVIAVADALGTAIVSSGLATAMSNGLLTICGGSIIMSVVILTIASMLLTQIILDNAVIVIILPVAITTACRLGVSPLPFALIVLLASGANFLTSFSTPHMMELSVQGQYTERDIFRFGWPLTVTLFVMTVLLVLAYTYGNMDVL